jgi:hypothetical protein
MNIVPDILNEQISYELRTGIKPQKIYLGRNQMKMLLEWSNYNLNNTHVNIIGVERPTVNGLYCWEVNDDDHLACS